MKYDKERILELIRIADKMQEEIDEFIKDFEHYLDEEEDIDENFEQ